MSERVDGGRDESGAIRAAGEKHRHTIVRSERALGRLPSGEVLVEESYDCPCGKDMTQEALR